MSFALDTTPASEWVSDENFIAGKIGGDAPDTVSEATEAEASVDIPDTAEQSSDAPDAIPPADPVIPTDAPAVPPAVAAEAEDKWWREIELIGEIAEIERERQDAATELGYLTEQRKEAKKHHDELVIKLQQIATQMLLLTTGKTIPKKPKPEKPAELPDSTAEVAGDDAWKAKPTRELLAGIKGMGEKKLEAIADLAPTAGDLENLRAEASKDHKPFKDMLPKGCGQQLADAIEDRLANHVTNHDTPPASEQVKENAREVTAESATDAADSAAEGAAESDDRPPTLEQTLAEVLSESKDWDADDCSIDDSDFAAVQEGFAAFQDGKPYTACPYAQSNDAVSVRRWLSGWVCGERGKELQESQPTQISDALDNL